MQTTLNLTTESGRIGNFNTKNMRNSKLIIAENIAEYPGTIEETVNKLLIILTDAELQEIKTIPNVELVLLHFSLLGKDIRNAFGMNSNNSALLNNTCADNVSMEIIEMLWEKLQII